MGLQTGENAPSAGLDPGAKGTDIGGAIPLRGEQPFLRALASGTRNQQRRAERDCIKCRPHVEAPFRFFDVHRHFKIFQLSSYFSTDWTSMNPKAFQVGG